MSDFRLNASVVAELNAAIETHATVKTHAIQAARFAIESWDETPEAYKVMMSAYRSEFYAQDSNVYAIFDAACLLLSNPDHAISTVATINGKDHEIHTTGAEAVELSKNKMHKAAKALRADLGIGRKEGAGRKPRTPAAKVKEEAAAALSFVSMLDTMLKEENLPAFRKQLKPKGWRLTRIK
jgi:hypothetical protein